jgi:predicted nucleic-acid-binding Zn-ribbon protein
MPLDPSMIKKVEAWLEKNHPDLTCPVCQSTTWEPAEIGILMPFQDGRIVRSNTAYPFLPLFCKQCGYTYFFSAVRMGLMSSDVPPPPS